MIKRVELTIHYVEKRKQELIVQGSCVYGPITIGSVFECAFRYIPATSDEEFALPALRQNSRDICLKVEKIKYYRKFVEELNESEAAMIWLSGQDAIQSGEVIGVNVRVC